MSRLSRIVLITPPRSWPLRLAISGVAVLVLVLIPVVGLRLYRAAKAEEVGRLVLPSYVGVAERLAAAGIVRTERQVADPAVTPLEAGAALAPLLSWRDDDFHLELLRVPVHPGGALPAAHAERNPTGIPPSAWGERLIPAVRAGLPAGALRYLQDMATGPDDAAFGRFARAPGADLLGATIAFPPDSALRAWPPFLPTPLLRRVDQAFETWFARAAWQVHEQRPRAADSTLRQAANAAALLIDHGDFSESLAGLIAARKVALAMVALAEAAHDTARAQLLRQRLGETDATPFPAALTAPDLSMAQLRAVLPELMAREDVPHAFQWAYVLPVAVHLRFRACLALDISRPMSEAWSAASRRRLVRTASDSAYWEWLMRPPRPPECPLGDQAAG